jgi:hypothetical protein
MKFKKGDVVKPAIHAPSEASILRGVVVEVRENYESEFTNHPPPLFRVRWAIQYQTEWYYEEDIMAVG